MVAAAVSDRAPRLAEHARRGDLGHLILATLAINVLSLALPVLTLQIYDRILPNPGSGSLTALLLGVCVAVALETLLRLGRAYLVSWNGAAFEHRASCEAVRRVLGADLARLGGAGVGEQLHRLGAFGKIKDVYSGALMTTLIELGFVVVFLGLITYLASWLVLAPLGVLAVFAAHAVLAGRGLKASLEARNRIDDERYNFLIEALEGVHTIKAFAFERAFHRRYEHFEKRSSAANFAVTDAAAHTFNVGLVFSHVMIIAVIIVGAFFTLDGVISSGALVATVLLSGRIMQPVQRALALWARLQDVQIASKRAHALMATPQEPPAAKPLTPARLGTLTTSGLAFRYAENDPWLFKEVDLDLRPGDAVAISGAHGAGKSTLLKVLAGLLAPSEGEVLVDGVPVGALAPRERAAHVGLLTPDPVLFRGTLRDNITRFGLTPEASAREVATLLGVEKDVAKLAGGFDTRVEGNDFDPIAPGLRQRIAITRALAPKPRVILFDAADKALDRDGYGVVFDLLARLKHQAALVVVSDDENIRSLAADHRVLVGGQLVRLAAGGSEVSAIGYRSLPL